MVFVSFFLLHYIRIKIAFLLYLLLVQTSSATAGTGDWSLTVRATWPTLLPLLPLSLALFPPYLALAPLKVRILCVCVCVVENVKFRLKAVSSCVVLIAFAVPTFRIH